MNRDVEELFDDILNNANSIKEFVKDYNLQTYAEDEKTRLAVERAFEIIGEALNRIKKIDPDVLNSIREHREIISFRNILAHAYDHVENKIVWGIIEGGLNDLLSDIKRIK